jgi:8-oxo-dGTP pyrophosphatase MutT (NUDIX family)
MLFHPQTWQNSLQEIINQPFNSQESHLEMAPYRKTGFESSMNPINAAVGIHLFFENEPTLILIERPMTMRKHAGQVAFPGGKQDEEDNNLIDTALRESKEEIGISSSHIIEGGSLTTLYIPVSNFLVHSFVFLHSEKPVLYPNIDEVNQILELKISEILDPQAKSFHDIQLENGIKLKNTPCFKIQEKIIWGATSILLNELKHRIIAFHQPIV